MSRPPGTFSEPDGRQEALGIVPLREVERMGKWWYGLPQCPALTDRQQERIHNPPDEPLVGLVLTDDPNRRLTRRERYVASLPPAARKVHIRFYPELDARRDELVPPGGPDAIWMSYVSQWAAAVKDQPNPPPPFYRIRRDGAYGTIFDPERLARRDDDQIRTLTDPVDDSEWLTEVEYITAGDQDRVRLTADLYEVAKDAEGYRVVRKRHAPGDGTSYRDPEDMSPAERRRHPNGTCYRLSIDPRVEHDIYLRLSERQRQVWKLYLAGMRQNAIAAQLGVTPAAICKAIAHVRLQYRHRGLPDPMPFKNVNYGDVLGPIIPEPSGERVPDRDELLHQSGPRQPKVDAQDAAVRAFIEEQLANTHDPSKRNDLIQTLRQFGGKTDFSQKQNGKGFNGRNHHGNRRAG